MDTPEHKDQSSKEAAVHHHHGPLAPKKQWKDLSSKRRARIFVQAAIQLALTALALRDLRHRPADQVKGSKRLWALVAFVQPVGPIAYFVFGRKK
jgi:hypothetical protein